MSEPLILYSTNTWLAYAVSQMYYRAEHYVWCSPYFDSLSIPPSEQTIPPSSLPAKIYSQLYDDVVSGEQHSDKIRRNKAGILRGAVYKQGAGVITEAQKLEIYAVVERAQIIDFRPLVYVIPFSRVADRLAEVPVNERAHPLSRECRIDRLHRSDFDVIGIYSNKREL